MRIVDPSSRWAEQCLNEYEPPRVVLEHERATPDTGKTTSLVVFVLCQLLWLVPLLASLPALVR